MDALEGKQIRCTNSECAKMVTFREYIPPKKDKEDENDEMRRRFLVLCKCPDCGNVNYFMRNTVKARARL
jgi:hypothetical protein